MVTPQTVTIKKAKRSTFVQNKRHLTTHRIGDINVVDWRWTFPGDVFRYKCSHSIKADALLAPAFARMRVYTDLFWVSIKSIHPSAYEKLQNFDQQQKSVTKNGTTSVSVPYYLPSENIDLFATMAKAPQRSNLGDFAVPSGYTLSYVNNKLGTQYSSVQNFFTNDGNFSSSEYLDGILKWDSKHKFDAYYLLSQMGIPPQVCLPSSFCAYNQFPSGMTSSYPRIDQYFEYYQNSPLDALIRSQYPFGDIPTSGVITSGGHQDFDISKAYFNNYSVDNNKPISTLPFRAYQKVCNEWFDNSITTDPTDIYPDVVSVFNSGHLGEFIYKDSSNNSFYVYNTPDNYLLQYYNSLFCIRKCWYPKDYFNTASGSTDLVQGQNIGTTVLDLRKANAIQRLLEKRALVGGNRIYDFIAQHWNFFPDNIELDRPLHLGSDTDYVVIGEVLQTSESTDTSAQGSRSGTANAFSRGRGVLFNSPDYGILLCLSRIVPEIDYFSGIERKFYMTDSSAVPLPELAQIGFQSIYNQELTCVPDGFDLSSSTNKDAWAYAPRYSEFKDSLNQVSCEMATTRNYWHQSPQMFYSRPGFNTFFGRVGFGSGSYSDFRAFGLGEYENQYNSYLNNIFAITDNVTTSHFMAMYNIECTVNRALPSNDMPQL